VTAGAYSCRRRVICYKNLGLPGYVRSYRRDWVGFFIALMTNEKTQLKTRFLPHDYNARNDLKLINLQIKHGLEGLGLYWCLVEMVWEADNELNYEPELIAFALRTDPDKVKSVAEAFKLFEVKGNKLSSSAIAKRMAYFNEKSDKAKQAAAKRWNKESERNANAMQTHSERNAIKKEINKQTNNLNKEEGGDFDFKGFKTEKLAQRSKKPGPTWGRVHDIFIQYGLAEHVAEDFWDRMSDNNWNNGTVKDWEAFTEKAADKAQLQAYGCRLGHKPDPNYNPRG